MTVEEVRTRLRAKLEETYGVDEAAILMDRPPGGWGDVATHRDLAALGSRLNLELAALEARIDARFAALDVRFAGIDHRFDAVQTGVNARFDAIDHRFDRFEHQLLAQVDRRLRAQTCVTITTIVGAMGVLVAAIRL